jgi:hypothetical protein
MNKLLLSLFFTALFTFVFGQTGVIYNIAFRIDPELITQTKTQNKDHQILNMSTVEDMPEELSDTIAVISERIMAKELAATITCLMPEEKMIMPALPEHLMYLPCTTLNKAIKSGDNDYYIMISVYVAASGGVAVTLANETFSKVKPKVTLSIKAYDKNKEKVHEKDVVLKDFEKLRSHSFENTYGIEGWFETTDEVTKSETLTSDDILKMYLMALEEAY